MEVGMFKSPLWCLSLYYEIGLLSSLEKFDYFWEVLLIRMATYTWKQYPQPLRENNVYRAVIPTPFCLCRLMWWGVTRAWTMDRFDLSPLKVMKIGKAPAYSECLPPARPEKNKLWACPYPFGRTSSVKATSFSLKIKGSPICGRGFAA